MTLTPALEALIRRVADERSLPPAILRGLVLAESGGDPWARSDAGAMGLTQLMPETAAEFGVSNPWDPAQNLDGGARKLAGLIRSYRGELVAALAAYHSGEGNLSRTGYPTPGWLALLGPQGRAYPGRVLTLAGWSLLGEKAVPPAARGPGGGAAAILFFAGLGLAAAFFK